MLHFALSAMPGVAARNCPRIATGTASITVRQRESTGQKYSRTLTTRIAFPADGQAGLWVLEYIYGSAHLEPAIHR